MKLQLQTSSWPEKKEIPKNNHLLQNYNQEDTVLIQNHNKGPFDPKYIGDYRVVSLKGNQVEIQPAVRGPTEMKHIKHVKYILPTDKYIDKLPDYSGFGRKTTLRINPDQILDLHWKLTDTYHTTNIGQIDTGTTSIFIHNITVKSFDGEYKTSLSTETYTTQSRYEPLVCSIMPIV